MEVINEVRNELFNEVVPGVGYGQDLIALDIQRGRDNGIGSYNEVRESLGLPAVTSFAQITSNVTSAEGAAGGLRQRQQHRRLRRGHGRGPRRRLGRRPVVPGDHGQPVHAPQGRRPLLLPQRDLHARAEQALFKQGNTLAKVIEANTGHHQPAKRRFHLSGVDQRHGRPQPGRRSDGLGVPGITVELEDTSGDVLATTTTDSHGHYSFNQLSGPAANPVNASGVSGTGSYDMVLVLPSWLAADDRQPATAFSSAAAAST